MIMSYSIYSGAGNTFLLIDNRDFLFPKEDKDLIVSLCKKENTDGLILVENSIDADYRMRIFNRDSSEAEMCGNGLRAFVRFLKSLKIEKSSFRIETGGGIFIAEPKGEEVLVHMPPFSEAHYNLSLKIQNKSYVAHFLNTGVPHLVLFFDEIENVDVYGLGKQLRFHPFFGEKGTNVNFVSCKQDHIEIRTYERGVEAETLACGTGSTASALISAKIKGLSSPIPVLTRSKEKLEIAFQMDGNLFTNVTMQGPAVMIGKGSFCLKGDPSII